MEKYKYLFKNVGLLTLSSFGTKILSFLLIPLYTTILSTSDYGVYDIYHTTISLMMPILTLNIMESVMRFSLDSQYNKASIFTIGLRRVFISIVVFSIFAVFNLAIDLIKILRDYPVSLIMLFSGELIYELLSKFCRGIEKIKDIAIAGAINSISMLSLNMIFLLYLKKGLSGYFWANILAVIIPSIYLIVKEKVWRYVVFKPDIQLKSSMFSYSSPLVFNTISWWINNASDRYIVTMICGTAINGVYSVAYKVPSILNVFQSIFNQAWVLSAVKEFDEKNTVFYGKTYSIYNCGMIIACSGLILFDKVIARLLFANDFFVAWKYSPVLMISVVFGALSGYIGGIFSAAKQTKTYAKTTSIGSIINIILNFTLIHFIGAMGAAIATLVSYIAVWGMRLVEVQKIVDLDINIKVDILSYIILWIQAGILIFISNNYLLYSIEFFLFLLIVLINRNVIINLSKKLWGKKHD